MSSNRFSTQADAADAYSYFKLYRNQQVCRYLYSLIREDASAASANGKTCLLAGLTDACWRAIVLLFQSRVPRRLVRVLFCQSIQQHSKPTLPLTRSPFPGTLSCVGDRGAVTSHHIFRIGGCLRRRWRARINPPLALVNLARSLRCLLTSWPGWRGSGSLCPSTSELGV